MFDETQCTRFPRLKGADEDVANHHRDFVAGIKGIEIEKSDPLFLTDCRANKSLVRVFAGWKLVPARCAAQSSVGYRSSLLKSGGAEDDETPLVSRKM